jgi:hypothetical protein
MKKILLYILLCDLLLVVSVSYISATTAPTCDYGNHNGCNTVANTIVEGKITFSDDTLAGKAHVVVSCLHEEDGKNYTRNTMSVKSGYLKGTYFVQFPQHQCEEGDLVIVTATAKNGLSGTEEATVTDLLTKKCLDIDVALIDVVIPLVPEFGVIAGALTIFGALGTFFVVRRK